MLVVAGKFDEKKALEYINKYFGALPKPDRKLPATYTEEPPQDGERFVTLRRVGDVGLVGLLYHVPAGSHRRVPGGAESWPASSTPSRRAGSTRPWSRRRRPRRSRPTPRRCTIRDRSRSWPRSTPRTTRTLEKVRDAMLSVIDEVGRDRASPRRRSIGPARRCSRIASWPRPTPTASPSSCRDWGCTGRLAALFPQPRPHRAGHAGAGQGSRRQVPDAEQPDRRLLHPDRQARADARSRRRPTSPSCSRLQGPRGAVHGRVVRRLSPGHRGAASSGPSRSRASSWPSCPRRRAAMRFTCT